MPLPPFDAELSFADRADISSWCAFLCGNDGRVIRDFGEQLPRSSRSISARSLIEMIEYDSLVDFLRTVATLGAALGWQMRIREARSAGKLVFHAFQIPGGILVFATLTHEVAEHAAFNKQEEAAHLLYEAVHDLNNPISSIISSCDYLSEYSHENLNSEQREMIASIESSARALLSLSTRVFELSKLRWRIAVSGKASSGPQTSADES